MGCFPAIAWLAAFLTAITGPADSIAIAANARSMQPGELVVLTIAVPEPADGVRLHAFNREIPVYRVDAATWRGLVGIDLGVRPGTYTASVEARSGPRQLKATYSLKVLPRRFAVRVLKVDPTFVNPPPELEERIAREAAELERLWRQSSGEPVWPGPFVTPVPSTVASRFGARSIFNGQARSPHSGADFPSPTGAPVAAPGAGRVVLARDLYFSGNTVILDHGLGLFSLLAHLSVIGVQEGDSVATGQEIGKVGATGRVTGPHLHWGVRAGGARVDPLAVLAVLDHETPAAEMPASATGRFQGPRTAVRIRATVEVALIMGLILSIIWVVKPLGRPGLDLSLRVLVGVLLLVSPWLHGDSRERVGLRLDNFWRALKSVLPVTLIASGVAVGAGYVMGSIEPPEDAALELAYYFAWAAAQQYALQSVILLRLEDAGLRGAAPPAAAALFSVVHAPNPGLTILTFLGGLLWCSTFRKNPNIAAVALSHAILAVAIASALPPEVTGGYRIGPAYTN